nr:immunoglobulin heavy chain junction region [Macaca mulatta]MOV44076.1 immunoglobulin heavy chain junction region [Macaca mulatta]MOV44541.1 immunoglobulin heavy chain junction region [Macaca mulatta]MOV44976.1 immunoglobulin heavy chain junction region [Macaca mulatta]MOV46632.1 immunoglobulin heavy chain junction region [Macaca mulatta]
CVRDYYGSGLDSW